MPQIFFYEKRLPWDDNLIYAADVYVQMEKRDNEILIGSVNHAFVPDQKMYITTISFLNFTVVLQKWTRSKLSDQSIYQTAHKIVTQGLMDKSIIVTNESVRVKTIPISTIALKYGFHLIAN